MKQKSIQFFSILQIILLTIVLQSCGNQSIVKEKPENENGYVINNVSIFTAVPGKPVMENAALHIKNGLIAKISTSPLDVPGAEIIDGSGKTLLPGLIDFHTHITSGTFIPWKPTMLPTQDYNFEACLYSGITAVVDMGGKPPLDMRSIADDIESGKRLAPHLFFPGIGFTAPESHPVPMVKQIKDVIPFYVVPFVPDLFYVVESEKDMKKLDKHLASNPDFTKVFRDEIPVGTPKMSLPVLKEIVRRSHEKNIPVIVHIGNNDDLRAIIESGADGAAHNVYKERLDPALARELEQKKIFVIATMFVWDSYNLFVNKRSTNHYTKLELETIHSSRKAELLNPFPASYKEDPVWDEWNKLAGTYVQNLYPNIAVLKDAGVTVLAGTDTPNMGMSPGGSLHVELEHMVKAGFTPPEALISATSAAARVLREILHKDINFGIVEEGKSADLLLVNGNPAKNIKDTQNIVAVFFKGKRIERIVQKADGK